MKKALVLVLAMALFQVGSLAYAQNTPKKDAAPKAAVHKAGLSLTPDQAKSLKAISEEIKAKKKELRDNRKEGDDLNVYREKYEALNKEQQEKVAKVLSPDQFKKWKEMRENAKAKREAKAKSEAKK